MTPYEGLAKFVGPLAKPVDYGSCLAWDRRDIVYCNYSGNEVVRITPDSKVTVRIPAHRSSDWLSNIGRKFGISGIYDRRDARFKQHRVIKYFNKTEQQIPHGELMLTGALREREGKEIGWWEAGFALDPVAPLPTYATDKRKVKAVNAAIRKSWALHEVTYKMLEGSAEAKPRPNPWHARMGRKDRAKALTELDYDKYLKVSAVYPNVEGAINSCRLELKELTGCISDVVESKL